MEGMGNNLAIADVKGFLAVFERSKRGSVQEIKKFWGDKKIEEIHREVLEAKKKGLI